MKGNLNMKPLKVQTGLSLIEIMVALVISLFLLGGIVQVYIGNKSTYKFSDAISRIQENGRFALDTITSDVRMAGFFGCVPFQPDKNGDGLFSDDNRQILQNHLNPNNNYVAAKHDFLNTPPITVTTVNGSERITIKGAKAGQSAFVSTLSYPETGSIQVDSTVPFSANDIVIISNCLTANIFEISSASTTGGVTTLTYDTSAPPDSPGNINQNSPCTAAGGLCLLGQTDEPYSVGVASAYALQAVTYYIGVSDSGSGEPALRRILNNTDEELIEGVEQAQLLFGVDTDGDNFANQYLAASAVADMNQVTAIRIALVVRSDRDNLLDAAQTYQIFGVNQVAPDLRLRQVFSSTITLRNIR